MEDCLMGGLGSRKILVVGSNSHFGKIAMWERLPSPAFGRDGKMPLTQNVDTGSAS
ncbi:MAG: hypothetical protein QG552_3097 [Thermodesulfobacteriota bacterium]|nr:hypothetical protein [Thermodesulfobacteriota bacterium]